MSKTSGNMRFVSLIMKEKEENRMRERKKQKDQMRKSTHTHTISGITKCN